MIEEWVPLIQDLLAALIVELVVNDGWEADHPAIQEEGVGVVEIYHEYVALA